MVENRGLARASLSVQDQDIVLVLTDQVGADKLEHIAAPIEHCATRDRISGNVWIDC